MVLRAIPGLALLILASAVASGQELEVLPDVPMFPHFSADALAHQFSLSRVTDNSEWIGAIGLEAPLLQWGDLLQVGAGATVFNRIVKTPGHISVSTVDYRVDFPVDCRFDSLRLRAGYGHISSHYADDGIEQLGRQSISSVKDYVAVTGAWMVSGGFVYAGATFNYHNEPVLDRKWQLQAGGEVTVLALGAGIHAYCAIDLKAKEDVGWGSTQSYQFGLRLLERGLRGVRVAYTHRRGFEERGQVYNEQAIVNLLGLYLDLL